jgi:microcin C transport system permease protein
VIPTLFGIMVVNFAIIQLAPAARSTVIVAQLRGVAVDPTARLSGQGATAARRRAPSGNDQERTRGARGLEPRLLADLRRQFGFDKPLHERFIQMMRNYLAFDFGTSFFNDRTVVQLILDKMPVSISIGLSTTLIIYLVSIRWDPQGGARRLALRYLDQCCRSSSATPIPSFIFAGAAGRAVSPAAASSSSSRCAA